MNYQAFFLAPEQVLYGLAYDEGMNIVEGDSEAVQKELSKMSESSRRSLMLSPEMRTSLKSASFEELKYLDQMSGSNLKEPPKRAN